MSNVCRLSECRNMPHEGLCSKYLFEDILFKLWSQREVSHLFNEEEKNIINECPAFKEHNNQYKKENINQICFNMGIPLTQKRQTFGDEFLDETIET